MLLVDEWVFTPRREIRKPPKQAVAVVAGIVLVFATSGYFVLRTSDSAEAVAFRYGFEVGDTRSYQMDLDITGTPRGIPNSEAFTGTVGVPLTLEVVSKSEDGSAVIELAAGTITADPPVPIPATGRMRIHVAPDGRVSSVDAIGGIFAGLSSTGPSGATDAASNQFLFPTFPDDKIAEGDTWTETSTMALPFNDESLKMTITGTHEGYEDTNFGEAAKVRQVVKLPIDVTVPIEGLAMEMTGAMSMDVTSLLLPGTSELVSLEGTVTAAMDVAIVKGAAPGAPNDMGIDLEMKISMVRV